VIYERKKHERSPEGRGTVIITPKKNQEERVGEEEQSSCCS